MGFYFGIAVDAGWARGAIGCFREWGVSGYFEFGGVEQGTLSFWGWWGWNIFFFCFYQDRLLIISWEFLFIRFFVIL